MQIRISLFAAIYFINIHRIAFADEDNAEEVEKTDESNPISPPPASGSCPYKQGVHLMRKPITKYDGEAFTTQVRNIEKSRSALLKAALYYGEGTNSYIRILRDINGMMRENYKKMTKGVGDNIYPLIVASDFDPHDPVTGVGGAFTLYLADGSSKRISPTPPEYEVLKNLAHIPLGIYVIVGGYLRAPAAQGWISQVKALQSKLHDAIRATEAEQLKMAEKTTSNGLKLLKATVKHTEAWVKKGSVSVAEFEAFSKEVYPVIEESVTRAATIQADALIPALKVWKKELGSEWENTYFIIPTVWPVSSINPRYQAILQVVSEEQAQTHIIMIQNQAGIIDQRATLGRIVGDRAAALLIFGTKTDTQKELVFGLSSVQDFLSQAFQRAIDVQDSRSKGRKMPKKKHG